jgi:glycosyltransferase involved in cell wall biosynthesis
MIDGQTGLLTPVGGPRQLAERLDWMMGHADETCRMAAAGQRRCRQNFAVETVGDQVLDLYRATLESAAR